jgi:hypothetical protein
VVAAVAGIASPFDHAAGFEAVDERHEPAGRNAELARDGLLALPGLPADEAPQGNASLRAGRRCWFPSWRMAR